ncbi:MAG: response regulator [Flavobacteriales bacterium]
MTKIKLLYIDDEKDNLLAFRSTYRRIFDVFLANTISDANKILNELPIEVVIADQRMPEMTGVEFFESIINIYPNPIRILLTGYSDIKAVEDAINKGEVYRFINKPWNEFELKLTIENAYQLYHLREQNNKLTNKYQKVFSESSDAILIFDAKGRIIDFNKAALVMFETIKLNLSLSYFSEFITNEDELESIKQKICEDGILDNYECKISPKIGHRKICLVSANKICNNYGEVTSYQAVVRDVTKRMNMQQMLLKTAIITQDKERTRISRDLHDGIGQTLLGIKFQLNQLLEDVHENHKQQLSEITENVLATIQQLRKTCYDILPPSLSSYGIQKAIINLCDNYPNNDIAILAVFKNDIITSDKELEVSIYRIVQEFINNSVKYANCSEIIITFSLVNDQLNMVLTDNGIGFDINNYTKGLGISNIVSRVKSFYGTIKVVSNQKNGTKYTINLPFINEKVNIDNLNLKG